MKITIGQTISIILFLAALTTLLLNLRKISKWISNVLKHLARKDKKRIAGFEKRDRENTEKFVKMEKAYLERISELEAGNLELERKSRLMDEFPEGYWLIHNNVLHHRETGINYCWNCWNKINGRERRVLQGDEYFVKCNVCGIDTQLKKYPQLPRSSIPDY